jgi:flagellin
LEHRRCKFNCNQLCDHCSGQCHSSLRSEAGKLSTNLSTITIRQDFTANMINTLEDGAANLTNADMNEEGANMLMLQTRQQLGTTSLSLASQAAQSVLRLF